MVCEFLTCMGRATAHPVWPRPVTLGRDQKVKYNLISNTKSISKIFLPHFVRVLTNERYKIYQTGFSPCHQSHAHGIGLMGGKGSKIKLRLSDRTDIP